MTWAELLAKSAWRGSIVLAAAFAAVAGLRGASAAVRHFVWTAALASMVVLPAALVVAPKWSWRVERAERVESVVVVGQQVEQIKENTGGKTTGATTTTTDWVVGLWVLGCAVVGARFALGAGRAWWMARRAAEARDAGAMLEELRRAMGIRRRVRVLESANAPMPLTWGILRPVVLLPEGAGERPPARLRTVLLHELAHVGRLDLLAQAIAQAACCLYWFSSAGMGCRAAAPQRARAGLRRRRAEPRYSGAGLCRPLDGLGARTGRHAIPLGERSRHGRSVGLGVARARLAG
jgi:beta-lactamase regulating signal transducer with metallopeptidase domain